MFPKRGTSTFSYGIARAFPSPVYTYVIIIGGVILTVLFSFVAVAANAYEAHSQITTDLNATLAKQEWFQKAPFSWAPITSSSCQSALLSVGSSFMTTNRGSLYTLSNIQAVRNGTQDDTDFAPEAQPTFEYRNNVLEDCEIAEIYINILRTDNAKIAKNYWTWRATTAQATTSCTVRGDNNGTVRLNFLAKPPVGLPGSQITLPFLNFPTTNNYTRYGASLTQAWLGQIAVAMGFSSPTGNVNDYTGPSWGNSYVVLSRNPNVTDYRSLDFFIQAANFPVDDTDLRWMNGNTTMKTWSTQYVPGEIHAGLPNISTTVDAFGKSFYSQLAMDFGIYDDTNALMDGAGIRYLQSINDTELALAAQAGDRYNANVGTVSHPYADDAPDMPRLDLSTARNKTAIFAQYLCSVPKRKSGANTFFAVVQANLVFLGAVWTLFHWMVTTWVLPKFDARSNYCEGCVNMQERIDVMPKDIDDSMHSKNRSRTTIAEDHEMVSLASNDQRPLLRP